MEASAATPTRPPHNNHAAASPSPSPSSVRLWRPAAQRNLRNQWSRLFKAKDQWLAAAAEALSHATALVNARLTRRSMPRKDLGALKDMPGIRDKASAKLALREEQYRSMLLSAYQEMGMVEESQYSNESLARELVEMFVSELKLKRLLVLELLRLKDGIEHRASLDWADEIYDGESNEFQSIGLQSGETCTLPENWREDILETQRCGDAPSYEVLEAYLTTWLANVNINESRIYEIVELAIGEGIQIKLS
ncbi:hypothetical protein EJB05_07577, partial [Eragrostis curvula]